MISNQLHRQSRDSEDNIEAECFEGKKQDGILRQLWHEGWFK
jgi:hypothetical protein